MTKRLISLTLMLALLLVLVTGSALADEPPSPDGTDGPQHPVALFLSTQFEDTSYEEILEFQKEYGLGTIARSLQYVLASQLAADATEDPTDVGLTLDEVLALRAEGGWGKLYHEGLLPYHPGGKGLGSLIGGHRGLGLGRPGSGDPVTTDEAGYPGPPTDNPNAGPKWGEGGGPPGPPANTPGPKPDKGPGNGNGNGHSNSQGNGHSNNNGRGHTENSNPDEVGE